MKKAIFIIGGSLLLAGILGFAFKDKIKSMIKGKLSEEEMEAEILLENYKDNENSIFKGSTDSPQFKDWKTEKERLIKMIAEKGWVLDSDDEKYYKLTKGNVILAKSRKK